MTTRSCIVCGADRVAPFRIVDGQEYHRCELCLATFLEPRQRLPLEHEHAQYRKHQNDPGDAGYRHFLSRLARPLLRRLPAGCEGLDYGCGPGPALAAMLTEAGHRVRLYDPLFAADESALERQYDFVTCSEVVEHFHRPAEEFSRLGKLLRPGGWLAIMTCFQTDDELFAAWHYRRDPTHVVFYRAQTFHHLAQSKGWNCEIPAKDIALLRRTGCQDRCPEAPRGK